MNRSLRIAALAAAVSAFSLHAYAQTDTEANVPIPGSESSTDLNDSAERQGVAETPGSASDAVPVNPGEETVVPGSQSQTDNVEADVRESVAEGTDAMGETMPSESEGGPIVPGSGATFAAPSSTDGTGAAEQDEATTEEAQ